MKASIERNLAANEKDSKENRDDSQPLPARNVFLEKNRREPDGDRSVQRAKNTDHRDLFHLHSEIAEDKRAGIEDAHAQDHPAHPAAQKTHGLLGNKNHGRNEQRAGQADHPHRLHHADSLDDANSQQPKQDGKTNRREDGPAYSMAAPAHGLGVVFVRCFFSARNNRDTRQRANDSRDSHSAHALAGHPGKQQRQSRIAGRERRHHSHFSNLKCAVEPDPSHGIEKSSQKTPGPRLPSGTIREMPPAAEKGQGNSQRYKPNQLHVKHGTECANTMRGKTCNEIRAAPRQRRQQAQQNSHDELGGLAFLHFEAEDGHDFLEVFPDFALCGRIAQQIGGMIGRQQFSSAKFQPLSAKLGNPAVGLQQGFCGDGAQANNYFGSDDVDLAKKKRRASADFIFFRLAILRWTAFHYVADVHVFTLQAHGFDHLGQQFSRAPDERQALRVFIGARAFADENELRLGISVAKNNFVPRAVEFAARAFTEIFADLEQRIVRNFVHGFEERWPCTNRQGCDLRTQRRRDWRGRSQYGFSCGLGQSLFLLKLWG